MSKPITNEDAPLRSFHVKATSAYAAGGGDYHIEAQECRQGENDVAFVKYVGNMPYIVAIVPHHAFSIIVGSLPDAKELDDLQERVRKQMEEAGAALRTASGKQVRSLADLDDDMFSKGN